MLRPRHKLAAVLLCVVDLRGWWRGLLETPLLSSAHAGISKSNDSDWSNGGDVEALVRPGRALRRGHDGERIGCGAQEVEVQSQEWPAAGEHGVLPFVADSGLGYPRAHLRPDCPGFRQGHHREQNATERTTPQCPQRRPLFFSQVCDRSGAESTVTSPAGHKVPPETTAG